MIAGVAIVSGAMLCAAGQQEIERLQALQAPFDVALVATADFSGDGADELLVVGNDGELRCFVRSATGTAGPLSPNPVGTARLEDPAHSLVALVELLPESKAVQLVAATPTGLFAWRGEESGALASANVALSRRARFGLRVGKPTLASIARDMNSDQHPDFVLPFGERLELWVNQGPGEAGTDGGVRWPTFKSTTRVATEVVRGNARKSRELSNVLESAFAIPGLDATDVNGDGKPDLLVREKALRAFHLQRPDGSFGESPDVSVDLALFRDTIEEASIAPGRTLVLGDEATFESRDLDGDGIPDYAIAHRRKVWVFLASRAGPQFQKPVTILKTAEDTTALQIVALDDDPFPDLLLIKIQVPTVATIIRGVFGEWDVEIAATGYRSLMGKGFESSPSWHSVLTVRIPAILDLVKKPEQFLKRFEEAAARFRGGTFADFDGDGRMDIVLVTEDKLRAEVWLGREADSDLTSRASLDRRLRKILFEDTDTVWDLDRIAGAFADLAERRAAALTGGRPADMAFALDLPAETSLQQLGAADFDGDAREELYAVARPRDGGAKLGFVVYGLRRAAQK